MTKEFLVEWRINVEADTPQLAAARALEIQRNAESHAVVFDVYETDNGEKVTVDLMEDTGDADAEIAKARSS